MNAHAHQEKSLPVFERQAQPIHLQEVAAKDLNLEKILEMIENKSQRDATLLECVSDVVAHI